MLNQSLDAAVETIRAGGVIAYPTEHCFGLGCDPFNQVAVERILQIKQRSSAQGVIVIGSERDQFQHLADFSALPATTLAEIERDWPGPFTWLIPKQATAPEWISGQHASVAVRVTANRVCRELLTKLAAPLVSTSANRHGEPALLTAQDCLDELGEELDLIVNTPVGGDSQPSTIKDSLSGAQVR
ncbi:MAG: L-threonylcarbamoyladenylate synthase [Pseudomonadota bacterium]